MAKITWTIENSDNAPKVKCHNDKITGALANDDRSGEISNGNDEIYNEVVHGLCARVTNPKYQAEVYAATYYDQGILIIQSNIGRNVRAMIQERKI